MIKAFTSLLILFAVLAFAYAAVIYSPEQKASTSLHLLPSGSNWVSFAVENNEGHARTYHYEIFVLIFSKESLVYAADAYVGDSQNIVVHYPLQSSKVERVRIVLTEDDLEVSYYTGYEPKDWRPEIVQGLGWEKQDPLVKEFYSRVAEPSVTYERSSS